jgi:hypothetical protein
MIEVRKMNWAKMIDEIVELDPQGKWTYSKIGAEVGTSRSVIGRLKANPDRSNHIDDPKWSQGMALIELHGAVRKQNKIRQKLEDSRNATSD